MINSQPPCIANLETENGASKILSAIVVKMQSMMVTSCEGCPWIMNYCRNDCNSFLFSTAALRIHGKKAYSHIWLSEIQMEAMFSMMIDQARFRSSIPI